MITLNNIVNNLCRLVDPWLRRKFKFLKNFLLPADIAQYHTWLLSKVPNSQPIYLLSLMPGYPLLNFAVVTGIYILLSHRLFLLTSILRDALIPHDDDTTLRKNLITMALGIFLLWGGGFLLVQTGGGGSIH